MENKATALTVWVHEFDNLNEVEMIWLKLKRKGCNHGLGRNNTPLCLRPPIYHSPFDEYRLCDEHVEGYFEEDLERLAEYLRGVQSGLLEIMRRGIQLSKFAVRLASVELDACFSEDAPEAFSQAAE